MCYLTKKIIFYGGSPGLKKPVPIGNRHTRVRKRGYKLAQLLTPILHMFLDLGFLDLVHSLDLEHKSPATELGWYIKRYLDLGHLFSSSLLAKR